MSKRRRSVSPIYNVALSFAGADRPKALQIAEKLRAAEVSVFYDGFETASRWGEYGTEEFGLVYGKHARYALVLVSKAYLEREWTRHELRHMRARALREKGAYILPVRVDPEVELPGVPSDVLYLPWTTEEADGVVRTVLAKLSQEARTVPPPPRLRVPARGDAKRSSPLPPGRARAKALTPPVPPVQNSGWIVICDIVQFSEKVENEQLACVSILDETVRECLNQLKASGTLREDPYLNCTGDGFILVFPMGILARAETVLDFCANIVRQCAERKPDLLIRLGVHVGEFRANVRVFGSNHVIGRGPNHCARVAAVGDAGHVVVSEEFAKTCIGAVGDALPGRFSPGPDEEPIYVAIKHNRQAPVRLFEAKGLSSGHPRRFELLQSIEKAIMANLSALEKTVLDLLQAAGPPAILRLRLSVFLPDGDWLTCKRFRLKLGRGEGPSQTKYRILPEDRAEGALGLAYVLGRSIAIRSLPDPQTQPKDYTDAWVAARFDGRSLNLKADHIWRDKALEEKKWNRLPQALIAVPFSTLDGGRGVLCADTRNPLTDVSSNDFDVITRLMEDRAGTQLASLILARRLV